MEHPCIMVAAGNIKTNDGVESFEKSNALDEITAGSFTLRQRDGNKEPNFIEIEQGTYINALGLPNGGLLYLKEKIKAMIKAAGAKRLRISIAPIQQNDLALMTSFLNGYQVTLEVNLGCPNVWYDGAQKPLICHDVRATAHALAETMRVRGNLRVAVKLSPLPDEIRDEIIDLCYIHGVNEIVTMNTRPNVSTLDKDGKQLLSVPLAGLSGRAIQEEALEEVRKTRQLLGGITGASIRLVGVGGIDSRDMVRRMYEAGADAVQVGTHAFIHGPKVFEELRAA